MLQVLRLKDFVLIISFLSPKLALSLLTVIEWCCIRVLLILIGTFFLMLRQTGYLPQFLSCLPQFWYWIKKLRKFVSCWCQFFMYFKIFHLFIFYWDSISLHRSGWPWTQGYPPVCWDCKCASSHWAVFFFFLCFLYTLIFFAVLCLLWLIYLSALFPFVFCACTRLHVCLCYFGSRRGPCACQANVLPLCYVFFFSCHILFVKWS